MFILVRRIQACLTSVGWAHFQLALPSGKLALTERQRGSESPCRWLCVVGVYGVQLDRNTQAVKPFVIVRKNFLFSDASKGAEASALCFSMIETAKLNNLNVYGYLIYLLSELPKLGKNPDKEQLQNLMPWSKTLPEYCIMPKKA